MAEGLVRLKPRKATAGTYRRPAAKDSRVCPPRLPCRPTVIVPS